MVALPSSWVEVDLEAEEVVDSAEVVSVEE
jgi:hypothetical protein